VTFVYPSWGVSHVRVSEFKNAKLRLENRKLKENGGGVGMGGEQKKFKRSLELDQNHNTTIMENGETNRLENLSCSGRGGGKRGANGKHKRNLQWTGAYRDFGLRNQPKRGSRDALSPPEEQPSVRARERTLVRDQGEPAVSFGLISRGQLSSQKRILISPSQ